MLVVLIPVAHCTISRKLSTNLVVVDIVNSDAFSMTNVFYFNNDVLICIPSVTRHLTNQSLYVLGLSTIFCYVYVTTANEILLKLYKLLSSKPWKQYIDPNGR